MTRSVFRVGLRGPKSPRPSLGRSPVEDLAFLALCAAFACSGSEDDGHGAEDELPTLSSTDADRQLGANGPAVTVTQHDNGSCTIESDNTDCAGQMYVGENAPLDIFILFDQSGSMCLCVDPPKDHNECSDPECGLTRIEAVSGATSAFLEDGDSAGISVSIGYFGQQPIGETTCNEEDYAEPAVAFGVLPRHADAVMASLASVVPTGETPTGPAISAACGVAQEHKQQSPGHQVVILLITDGEPKTPVTCAGGQGPCCPTLEDAVTRTKACRAASPSIETYVLGVGPFLSNLDEIAVAGGTRHAYLVEEGDVEAQVLAALNAIRAEAAIPCRLSMPPDPPGQTLAPDKVNLVYADSECDSTVFPYVGTQSACGKEGGWYYDDPEAPELIELCPSSCEQVAPPGGQLVQTVGCDTVTTIL